MKQIIKRLLCRIMGKKIYLEFTYKRFFGIALNLKNPKRFTEKIYWLKVYNGKYLKKIIQDCYDKYTVRDYVRKKGFEKNLNVLYGVYDKADDIDFELLPHECIFKITQSCGMNLIIKDKNEIDERMIKTTLKTWQEKINICGVQKDGIEDYVFNGNAKIICEKLLHEKNGEPPKDYSIYCFNGMPKFISCETGVVNTGNEEAERIRNTYDLEWNLIPFDFGRPRKSETIFKKPQNLDEIIEFAKAMSDDFVFARVDGYIIDDEFVFGEITWIPMGGNLKIEPFIYEEKLGNILKLPDINLFK